MQVSGKRSIAGWTFGFVFSLLLFGFSSMVFAKPHDDAVPDSPSSTELAYNPSARFVGNWNGYFMLMWWRFSIDAHGGAKLYAISLPGRYDTAYRWQANGEALRLISTRTQQESGSLMFKNSQSEAFYFKNHAAGTGAYFYPSVSSRASKGFPAALHGRWLGYAEDWCYLDIQPGGQASFTMENAPRFDTTYRWVPRAGERTIVLTSHRPSDSPRVIKYLVNSLGDEYIGVEGSIMMVRCK